MSWTPERPQGVEGPDLFDLAQGWLEQDPDPETRAELEALLEDAAGTEGTSHERAVAATAELRERFSGRLAFGTAGLRAELGAGPMRMNRVVVTQAAAGLAAFLLHRGAGSLSEPAGRVEAGSLSERQRVEGPTVVIGYDGRKNSDVFARDAAEILAGAGLRVHLLPRALPTPVLAFAVRHLDAAAGVMITASHNPPRDNGMKVYLGGADEGSQIVPPVDGEIAAEIARVAGGSVNALARSVAFELLGDEVVEAYVAATASLVPQIPAPDAGSDVPRSEHPQNVGTSGGGQLRLVYSAMHGVGLDTARRVFAAAGLPELIAVPAQAEPDGAFPTVAFPNPEEPGALDLSYAAAREHGADLVVVNDPDA
ncbi:MAG: hypothetical protein J7480_06755, partial [Microbacteriaceae bacterium]|nr:hypothetical protein [Microbacteriaceae bacterium]